MASTQIHFKTRATLIVTAWMVLAAKSASAQPCLPDSSTSPARIVTVDGMKLVAIAPGTSDFTDTPPYLPAALVSMNLPVPDDHIVPFIWSRDPSNTNAVVVQLQEFLAQQYACAQASGQKFIVVSHSWGTILTHIALSRNAQAPSHVTPDLYITLGSPLGVICEPRCLGTCITGFDICPLGCPLEATVSDYVALKLVLNGFNPLSSNLYPDALRWVNYWAWGDSFSAPLNQFLPHHPSRAEPQDVEVDSAEGRPCLSNWIAALFDWHMYDSLKPGGDIDNQPLLDEIEYQIRETLAVPALVPAGTYVGQTAAMPGSQITLHYAVSNPGPNPISLFLGASIRPVSGGSYMNSLDCEGCGSNSLVTIAGDVDQSFTRCFTIPANAPQGPYEVCYAIWSPSSCGPGTQYDSFCRADLTV